MPFCSYKRCVRRDEDLPVSEFINEQGKRCTRCSRCRFITSSYARREMGGRSLSNGAKGGAVVARLNSGRETPKGSPPKFAFPWAEQMYNEWLLDLVKSVDRS